MKIYLASSWRNKYYDEVYHELSQTFDNIYNFRSDGGFHWSQVLGPDWKQVPLDEYRAGLTHPEAVRGFIRDNKALRTAVATVMVLPAGSSAHLELGVAVGLQQFTAIFAPEPFEPELMYKFVNLITDDLNELIHYLTEFEAVNKQRLATLLADIDADAT